MVKHSKDRNLPHVKVELLFADIAKSITSSLNVNTIITSVMKHIDAFFGPDNWSLLLMDQDTNELYFAIAKGINKTVIKKIRLKVGEGIAGHAAKTARAVYVNDVKQDTLFNNKIDKISGFQTRSIIAMPIVWRRRVLGVIELINFNIREFSKQEVLILKSIADFCAIALSNAMSYQYVLELSSLDPLTGVYNRKHLNKYIRELNAQQNENGQRCYVVAAWIDIDEFKVINDTFGHSVGDVVLQKLAGLLQHSALMKNHIFRMGGDEFLIILTSSGENGCVSLSEHLATELHELTDQISPARSFSFGIAHGPLQNYDHILIKADEAMYQHKLVAKHSHR